MLRAQNIQYEMADRTRAIPCGGIGAFRVLAHPLGLIDELNSRLHLPKAHLPYHESDHVLNVAYNTLTGGTCFDDIALRRNDETYLDALDAQRIPAPTTAGDFTRRFAGPDVVALMEGVNAIRPKLWRKRLRRRERREAILDVDGIVAPTTGECKEGMDIAYNGVWGYHPLLLSLANTAEPLFLVNRPDIRYFFTITNIEKRSAAQIVYFSNDRCNQENLIEQLKNGLNALRMPTGDLVSSWAYMVIASLAWTLKAWFALVVRSSEAREELLRMEFRRFLHAIVALPRQIVRTGHRVVCRILGYNEWTRTFLRTFDRIRQLEFT